MIDLHLHLDGSLAPLQVIRYAKISGVNIPSNDSKVIEEMMAVKPDCKSLSEYLQKFNLPLSVLQTPETMELSVYDLVNRLSRQGLKYAEIRFAPQLHKRNGMTQAEVVKAAIKGLNDGMKDSGMPARLILCCMRGDKNYDENMETVKLAGRFLGQGVCAVDLAGNEAAYPTEMFEDVFKAAGDMHIPVTIHAGEAAGPESIRTAIRFGARRIGHGIAAASDMELMKELRDRNIFLEMCYSSNLQTKAVQSSWQYPLGLFIKEGVPVTINTDNMTVSSTTLSNEFDLLRKTFGYSEDIIRYLELNAEEAAFCHPW